MMKNKLKELLKETFEYTRGVCIDFDEAAEINAEYLISHGVTIREKAEWREVRIVRHDGNGKPYTQFAHECSKCKWLNKKKKGWNHNFCPNCSADMRREK